MPKKPFILLSADADVSLYQVTEEIEKNLDQLIEDFFKWKKTKHYDETLFVRFLKNQLGDSSITFIKVVGSYAGSPDMIMQSGKDVTEAYQHIKWFNF